MKAGAARLLALMVAIAATGAGEIALAPTSEAAACGETKGVTVVVDDGLAGGTLIGCAAGDPTTGLDALLKSGHAYTFLPGQPGLVCTINAKPDPCNNAPTNAYWSYWHAQPGGSWSYGSTGAGSHNPEPGSIDGWSFGSGKPPSSRPPAATTTGTATAASTATAAGTTAALRAQARASATSDLPPDGRGGLGGLAVGVVLVLLLGGMAGLLARRRRHVND